MKKRFVHAVLCALTLAAPAAAERIYVPALGSAADGSPLATKVWAAGVDGVGQVAQRAAAEKAGLIAIEADSSSDVSAWMAGSRGEILGEVPSFGESEAYVAGADVQLSDLPRPRAMTSLILGAANLSEQTAFCQATLFNRGGRRIGEIPFEVEPKSLARESAAEWMGRIDSARVTCDQSFFPFGLSTEQGGLAPVFAKDTGPNGACQHFLTLTPIATGEYAAGLGGQFHDATKANPKGIICIKSLKQLNVAKAVYEWDVKVGPWSNHPAGVHNLGYYFLERYRSGVIGNVNALGPNKSIVKVMQNAGMPRGHNTNQKASYLVQKDRTYHVVYTFDAQNKRFTLQVLLEGVEVVRFSQEVKPGNNQTLVITPYGKGETMTGLAMVAEFGNYIGRNLPDHPEQATIGWKYSNFNVKMTLKK
jgi:hypothetical protein